MELMHCFKQMIFPEKNALKLWVVRKYLLALRADDIASDMDG